MTNSETKTIRLTIEKEVLDIIDSRASALNMDRKEFLVQCALSKYVLDDIAALEAAEELASLNNLINNLKSDLQEAFREKEKFAWQHLKSRIC